MGDDMIINMDEMIRVVASIRTDVNAKMLALACVAGELPKSILSPELQSDANQYLESAIEFLQLVREDLNEVVKLLGGKQVQANT